ncbi:xyloside xylosyltransferase 1 isoform X6 [Eurytemora carolleeae]|nr:xyloside xylosyltransferase 1 isoform X6 [Eurytemora carolleeae]|eukprot:XP_023325663.1 xyloside xylosyltransferase 1-like isoform X6 [Eurytemora affinis]
MEFTVDIKELYDEFTKLESSPAILGIGLDLSPHYFGYLKSYIESHPGTDIGKPGKNQGLNTGVVLYRLDKMRVNELYNSFLNKQKIDYLVKKFGYPFALAEQDFFTNLGFMFPDLFHILPCQFNTQTSLQYLSSPFENIFKSYHYCDRKENIKIFHLNGCGPTPAQCGGNNKSSTVYDKDHDLHFYHIEVQVFWEIMEGLYRDEMKETQET